MHRDTGIFIVPDINLAKAQILRWVNHFEVCAFFDNNNYAGTGNAYECIGAAGCITSFNPGLKILPSLSEFLKQKNDWLFGHINYDLKNEIENLQSNNPALPHFPKFFCFSQKLLFPSIKIFALLNVLGMILPRYGK